MAGKYMAFIWASFKFNLKTAMEYRLSFLVQLMGMFLNDVFWMVFWYIFFLKTNEIRGWNFQDVLLLYSAVALAFGISYGLFANHNKLSQIIEEGGLDFYLTLPKDPLLSIIIGRISVPALGDIVFAMFIFFITQSFTPVRLILFIISGILSGLILLNFSIIINSMTFFTGRNSGLSAFILESLLCCSMYPIDIFRGFVKLLLFTLLPAAFISYVPVCIIKELNWNKIALLLIITVLFTCISRFTFYYGLKRYTSGNLITARL